MATKTRKYSFLRPASFQKGRVWSAIAFISCFVVAMMNEEEAVAKGERSQRSFV